MNLGLFNRVNFKESTEHKGMYSEWTSLRLQVHTTCGSENPSVLEKFGESTGKEVALGVVRHLASNLGITQIAEPSPLTTDKEVNWCMEVICFGLSLPLSEHEIIKDCVNVYCEWLSAFLPSPKICVPKPVCEDANIYGRKIISHLHHLFVPRKGEDWPFLYMGLGQDTINRQALLCHRVLRTLQQIAHDSKILEMETWNSLLMFLLAINDTLLSPPTVKDDVADQLCERVLSVLFEVWLIACSRCFPTPPLWKTLRECCLNWRHRVALVEQWNRVTLALTSKVLSFMYGPNFPDFKIGDEELIPSGMSNDCIVQSWYRFLHTIGDPVNLTKPEVISQTQKFLQFAISSDSIVDPCQHPCLKSLPLIFLKAIKGVAGHVDAFLGIAQPIWWEEVVIGSLDKNKEVGPSVPPTHSPTPPVQRRLTKSFSVAPSSVTKGIPKSSLIGLTSSRASVAITNPSASSSGPSSTSSLSSLTSLSFECRSSLASERAKCNSILHLFGEWLFEAAFVGSELLQRSQQDNKQRPSSIIMDGKGSINLSQADTLSSLAELPPYLSIDKYESGRAEAFGALCRIICAKKTGEEILTVYLARFYLALQQGLKMDSNRECGESLVAILMNCSDLFRLDLDGVRVLLPYFISALEVVLPDRDFQLNSNVSKIELRKASINILLSVIVLPLHFQNTPIKELINSSLSSDKNLTFAQLKPRIVNLLMNALQVETDSANTHLLLGGLFLCVQDSADFESVEQVTQPLSTETTSNLLSSVASSETASMTSGFDYSHGSLLSMERTYPDFPELLHPYDSAHALFVRATYLVCHRLISSWKTDLSVSLAALELLSGLARIHIKESAKRMTDALECKRAVKWLCDYIVYQCSRPPPAHSKDLHSTIVAAFHCCAIWLLEHPYLLRDRDCLMTVLEVCELGVSGSKSVGKPGEQIKMKEEKELKPASMRVRDAAENLLTKILEQVGHFPNECGPESISSLLDEITLLQYCNTWTDNCAELSIAVKRFRYFVTEGSVMLALLEEPLGNDQDPQPTVTLLIRGPFGRHAWTMQLRHLPRHRSGTKYHSTQPTRPVPMHDAPIKSEIRQKYFPEGVDQVSLCKIDQSIPSLESVMANDEKLKTEGKKLEEILNRQVVADDRPRKPSVECTPPPICHEFQTARLFLSHFGFLPFDAESENEENCRSLIALDNSAADFCKDLLNLDKISPRTCDTVHIFYVKAGQTSAQDIVENVTRANGLSAPFLEFIHTLGWPVDVNSHPGWTGNINTSWKIPTQKTDDRVEDKSTDLYDGQRQVLYWADACSEIAFVIPSANVPKLFEIQTENNVFSTSSIASWYERSLSEGSNKEKKNISLDFDKQPVPPLRRSGNRAGTNPYTSTKIMVTWLESFEDHLTLPINDLLQYMNTGLDVNPAKESDVLVIGLHWLNSGMLRVNLRGNAGRVGLASPLVNGMIASRRALGSLVRQTALNMAKRRRLDYDVYQPPHVKRRLKVQEMVQKYKKEMSPPELFTYLFNSP